MNILEQINKLDADTLDIFKKDIKRMSQAVESPFTAISIEGKSFIYDSINDVMYKLGTFTNHAETITMIRQVSIVTSNLDFIILMDGSNYPDDKIPNIETIEDFIKRISPVNDNKQYASTLNAL